MSPVAKSSETGVLNPESPTCANADCHCASAPSTQSSESRTQNSGKKYWRSLEELANTSEFQQKLQHEFPAAATEFLDSSDRRHFLKIMSASMALAGVAGLAGCRRWPEEKIAPFAHRPAGRAPGIPVHYATMMEVAGQAQGLLATSFDGRPIKIEGNPQHPINQGSTDLHAQASILDLYDADRSRSVVNLNKPSTWADFEKWSRGHFVAGANGIAVLSESTSSPSAKALKQQVLKRFPSAQWHEYEPLHNDNEVNGAKLAFGATNGGVVPQYSFDKAKTIVALDSDFLGTGGSGGGAASIKWTRQFAAGRRAEDRKSMNRLYVFESGVSLTGVNADHRVAVRNADVALIAARLAAALVPNAGGALGDLANAPIAANDPGMLDLVLKHLVDDLKAADSPSIVIAGPRQPAEVHYLVHLVNDALGNVGKTISYLPADDATPHAKSLKDLAANITAGKVQTLVIIGGNPVYNAPADLKFADLLKSVATTIHLSHYVDETSSRCTWHVNRAHYLEAWGDARSHDGTLTIGQPLIEPLFNGKSPIELLATIAGDNLVTGYDIVRRNFALMFPGANIESQWRTVLHQGFVENKPDAAKGSLKADAKELAKNVSSLRQRVTTPGADSFELVFAPSIAMLDGRYANNGWLQELPDPIGKLTWDNAIQISPATSRKLGVSTGDMVSVKSGAQQLVAPVMIIPGQFNGSLTLTLGYGREFEGRICKGSGFDFNKLRAIDAMDFAGGAVVTKTGDSYPLALTQDHHSIDPNNVGGSGVQERLPTLFREATLNDYQEHPDFAKHRTHVVHRLSLWEEDFTFQTHTNFDGARYAWAMSIDLNACTGCNACVIACQAENNIPIVGKDQVSRGREMHWIRVDRYFTFKPTETDAHGQAIAWDENSPQSFMLSPLTCMHCENAPCEQVCPVAATTHDEQGLNMMVYNRCIGTRYCSNNCPYKVRRFNYFDYNARGPLREQPGIMLQVKPEYYTESQSATDPLRAMQYNPDVTVRMRGIMEKCTYCVQRITRARIDAKNQWVRDADQKMAAGSDKRVPIKDGSLVPACAQACPAQAIVFGDLLDPSSRVSKLHKHERSYQMLEELNTKPRTRYMAKLRNPHPALAAKSDGHAPAHADSHAEGHG